jgi:hypothetical protein
MTGTHGARESRFSPCAPPASCAISTERACRRSHLTSPSRGRAQQAAGPVPATRATSWARRPPVQPLERRNNPA